MRPDDGIGDAPGGPRQYMTTRVYEPATYARSEVVPGEWWGEPPHQGGAESELNLLNYWRTILKHRWVVLGIFIAAVSIGVAATLLMTPIYTASTTIQIDREAAKVVDLEGVAPSESAVGDEFFQTQYGLLKSASLAGRVVDDLGLARDDKFIKAMGSSVPSDRPASELTDIRRKRAISLVSGNLGVRPVRGSRLVTVTFNSPSPALSARIANGVAEAFIQSNLGRRYESASYAREFLEERLKQVKARLEESERQLVAYAANEEIINVNAQPAGAAGGAEQTASQSLTASDLVAMNAALAAARSERIRAEQRWRQAQGSDAASLPEVLQSPTIQALRQQRAKLQAEYQDKLSVYKPEFPAMVALTAQIGELDRQIKVETEAVRRSIQGQYQVALQQENSLAAQVSGLKSGVMDLRNRSIQYNILQREVDTNRTLYDGLLQRYKEVGIAGGVGSNNISIVDRATVPGKPSRPDPLLNVGIAALLGLAIGVLAAFLLELMDESVHAPDDVETKLGLPLLGAIPAPPKGVSLEEVLEDPRSAISEAYYSVRTALQFSTATGVPDVLLVTSSRASEGKSTTSRAIAQNFARLGMRVLLIDGDLRNPSLHRMMVLDNHQGLSNLLTGSERLENVVQATPTPNLFFVPCGPLPPSPAELLGAGKLRHVLADALGQYDLVVIDGPPVLGLADAPILANAATGVLMVIAAGETKRGQARIALRRLQQGDGARKIVGGILTKFMADRAAAAYGYSYEYEYGERPQIAAR